MTTITLNNGVEMPLIGFGTWNVRGTSGERTILTAIKVGYRLIDSAKMYGNEEIVGSALKKSGVERKEFFITTKLDGSYTSYARAARGIDESLRRMQTDYIDLMLIHEPYRQSFEMWRAMVEAMNKGKLRAIGVSNFNRSFYEKFIADVDVIPAVNQFEAHVFYCPLELKKFFESYGTIFQAWSPLTEGRRDIVNNPTLRSIGQKYNKTAAQVALRFLTQQGIAIAPKSARRERMIENLSIEDFTLDGEDLAAIRRLDEHQSLFGWY